MRVVASEIWMVYPMGLGAGMVFAIGHALGRFWVRRFHETRRQAARTPFGFALRV